MLTLINVACSSNANAVLLGWRKNSIVVTAVGRGLGLSGVLMVDLLGQLLNEWSLLLYWLVAALAAGGRFALLLGSTIFLMDVAPGSQALVHQMQLEWQHHQVTSVKLADTRTSYLLNPSLLQTLQTGLFSISYRRNNAAQMSSVPLANDGCSYFMGAALLPREVVCGVIFCVDVAQLWFDLVWLVCPACIKWWLVALHVFNVVDNGRCCWTWCSALGSSIVAVFLVAASSSDAAEAGRCGLFSLIYAGAGIMLPMKWRTRCLWWCCLAGMNGILCYIIWFADPAGGEVLICYSAVLLEVEFSVTEGYCA
ncbi:hypothetical protein Nepgr_003999 [Nepenthes gracilis]|uniref:Uncharacterized protein n=1 Tax=Nepenthes gracilis TaxID=150966 RepID=A0AAD3XEN5_NEPGR|nr:hypothetical protein Nepgr_003999 [Nepenthes gracilis]